MRTYAYIGLKKVPAARLLLALMTGILLEWYGNLPLAVAGTVSIAAAVLTICYALLPPYKKFKLQWLQGIFVLVLFAATGALLTYFNNIQHEPAWYEKQYDKGAVIIATLEEPLVEKAKTFKAIARVTAVQNKGTRRQARGSVILYFKKDSALQQIGYGSQIAFCKPAQTIQNTGNPGGFNYQRYMLFQGITGQVYLQPGDYVVVPGKEVPAFPLFLQQVRTAVITALQTYIPGKKEQGVAEALLIGYRNDLDKQLVQSYSNTGVVHIIAISGLHLGMIYGVLVWLFSPFKNRRWYKFAVPPLILLVLWMFTFIAGAVPSIVRSAVMFSFIAGGECLQRKANIYNTLAASALCLLIYNPFYLWDVGFQLSYTAVLSIVVFMKPVYNWFYIENQLLDTIWKLAATNIAAQVFTLPVVLFYFHQLPLLFLLTNLIVVPLSTIILFIEIFLLTVAKWVWLATLTGKATAWLLWLMNSFIEYVEQWPFAVWQYIKMDIFQAIVLFLVILLLAWWLLAKAPKVLPYAIALLLVLTTYTGVDIFEAKKQHKLVVYNVPKQTAIDVVQGSECTTWMTAGIGHDNLLQNFYIKPSRILLRCMPVQLHTLTAGNYILHTGDKTICIVGAPLTGLPLLKPLPTDVVIITGNPKITISRLQTLVSCRTIIFDNTNTLWKIEQWKKDCKRLHLRFHCTAQQGAFVMDL